MDLNLKEEILKAVGLGSKTGKKKPLRSAPVRPAKTTGLRGAANRFAFNPKVREALYDDLATKIENGEVNVVALRAYRDLLIERGKRGLASILVDILRRLEQGGTSFARAFKPWIPEEELRILDSCEQAGNLVAAFETIIMLNQRKEDIYKKVRGAAIMPFLYILLIYGLLLFVGIWMVPHFANMLAHPTGSAALLYAEGRFVDSAQAFIPPVVVGLLVVAFVFSLRRWTGKYRAIADRYMPYSLYREIQGYIWLISFISMLKGNNIADQSILKQQVDGANPWLKERLRTYLIKLRIEGMSFPEVLKTAGVGGHRFNFPTEGLIDSIGSVYGKKDTAERLERILVRWSLRFDEKLNRQIKAIAVTSQIAVYAILGFILIAMNAVSTQITMSVGHM